MQKTLQYDYWHLWRKSKCYVPFFVLGLMPYHALAQQDTVKKLKEVKVSSPVLPQIQTVTPSQTVSSSDFIKYSAFTVADAIRNFAGVNIQDYGGIGGMQTVSVRSLGADNVAVLYNSIQLNDAQNGEIDLSKFNLINIQQITLFNAQPLDICQTARAFASANVLAIQTIQPKLSAEKPFKIIAGIKGGSFGLVNPYLQWQQRVSKYWSFVINGYDENANGRYKYKENADGSDTLATRKNSDVHTKQADAELYWAKSDSSKFNLQFNFYNSDRGLPSAVVLYAAPTTQRLYNRDYIIQSGYHYIAKNSFELLLNTKLSQSTVRYTDTGGVYNATGMIVENYMQREAYQSVAIAYHILSNWKVSYSSDADISNLQSDAYKYDFPTRLSLFNVLATNLTLGKWLFQGNILNTYIDDHVKSGTAASSKSDYTQTVIASYHPLAAKELEFRAFYKSTFRNPTFSEQYYYAIAPRPLKPEYTSQYDAGVAYTKTTDGILEYLTVSADAYYNNVKDKIIYIPTRSPDIPSVVNLGKVDIRGLDVVLKSQFKPFYNWKASLTANYTYQNAIDITDPTDTYYLEQIPYTPKNTLAVNAGVMYKQFGVYYNQILASHRYYASDNTPQYYLPGYTVSDASAVYNFKINSVPVLASLEVNNLYNKNYVIVNGFPMPGRSFRFTFQITI
ncbi:TonB-dependent receptor [Mucilaginibacter sp. E4BP6]|uniref:TonB-dependent receptor n=1 Tax=Mucilaginibacter sp. E4BP6 TaxID=2723089 RepID=UPI0015CB2383|nr:TonB-dependent receptor plug domain-containing protein [Mucilaginibacter sp. E4BP6]NYE66438.1 outer membrane cobalamin receptor [Mucilaginibacter sp. E4BP6]